MKKLLLQSLLVLSVTVVGCSKDSSNKGGGADTASAGSIAPGAPCVQTDGVYFSKYDDAPNSPEEIVLISHENGRIIARIIRDSSGYSYLMYETNDITNFVGPNCEINDLGLKYSLKQSGNQITVTSAYEDSGEKFTQIAVREDNLDLALERTRKAAKANSIYTPERSILELQDVVRCVFNKGDNCFDRMIEGKSVTYKNYEENNSESNINVSVPTVTITNEQPQVVETKPEIQIQVTQPAPAVEEQQAPLEVKTLDFGLETAILKGQSKDAQRIIKAMKSNEINLLNKEGRTALMLAVEKKNLKVVQALIKAKADVNVQTEQKETALHLASQDGSLEIVNALLSVKGIQINAKTVMGETALHKATINCRTAVVNALLAKKADVKETTFYGWSALDLAIYAKGKKSTLASALKAKGAKVVSPVDPTQGGAIPLKGDACYKK